MGKTLKRFIVVLGVGGFLSGVYACAADGVSTTLDPSSSEIGISSNLVAGTMNLQRVASAMERGERSGQIHHTAMQDLIANLPNQGPLNGRLARRCEAAAQLTMRHMPAIEQAYGKSWTAAEKRHLVSQAFRMIGPCSSHSEMSLFGEVSFAFESISTVTVDDPPGTEAVVGPINALVEAVKASDGSVAAVSAITAASLTNNAGLGSVDLEILASVAALANSSAAEWNTYSAQGGFGTETWQGEWDWNANGGIGGPICTTIEGQPPCEHEQSLFAGFWRKAAFVVGSDVIGCGTAAAHTWWTGAGGAGAACTIWGIGTSATTLLGVLLI